MSEQLNSSAQQNVSRDDVILVFRFLIGREPEDKEIAEYLASSHSVQNLVNAVTVSEEFFSKYSEVSNIILNKTITFPKYNIQTEVDNILMTKMLEHIENVWTTVGKNDPFWSVLVNDNYASENINRNLDDFYRTNDREIKGLISTLERNYLDINNFASCIEFGCGVGRMTAPLATYFDSVIGVDISEPHIELARKYINNRNISNVDFVKLHSLEQLGKLPKYDFIYSKMVLQHNPPPIQVFILRKLFSNLNDGGCALFQIPTYIKNYRFDADEYLQKIKTEKNLEEHAIPQNLIFKIANGCGLQPLEVMRDGHIGGFEYVSSQFLFIKERHDS